MFVIGDNETKLFFPTAFSPNKDGHNDVFRPAVKTSATLKTFLLTIYDSKNNEIFRTTDLQQGWNGYSPYTNNPLINGPYSFTVNFTTASGKSFSGCGCMQLFFYTNTECMETENKVFIYEEQIDVETGTTSKPCMERFCDS